MYHELVRGTTIELREAALGEAPEVLDSVHMALAAGELILAVEHAVMVVAVENQTVISLPTVRVNGRAFKHKAREL